MAWHFDPMQHRGPGGKWQASGADAGRKALRSGTEAASQFEAHPASAEIGAHLGAAQQAIQAGEHGEAAHHLTSALAAISGSSSQALKATISSRRSKLPKTGHAEQIASQIMPPAEAPQVSTGHKHKLNVKLADAFFKNQNANKKLSGPAGPPAGTAAEAHAKMKAIPHTGSSSSPDIGAAARKLQNGERLDINGGAVSVARNHVGTGFSVVANGKTVRAATDLGEASYLASKAAGSSEAGVKSAAKTKVTPPPAALTGDAAHTHVKRVTGLSQAEKQALADYGMSWGYRTVNPYHNQGGQVFDRNIMALRPANTKETADAKRITAGLDGAFAKAEPTTQDIKVSRGVSNVGAMFGEPGSMTGKTFTSPAYVSTTTVKGADTGYGYGYSKSGHGMGKLTIHVPAGSKVVPANDFEHELLLPRGSAFSVMSDVVKPDGTRAIELRYEK